jgi:hypothetical protein
MVECARQKGANPDSWSVEGSAQLPTDVIYEIAAFLSERDICSLEICSRFWHELCSSDFIWFHLFRKRWSSSEPIGVSSFLNHEVKENSQREDCVCTLVRPCGRHGLYKLPHEVREFLNSILFFLFQQILAIEDSDSSYCVNRPVQNASNDKSVSITHIFCVSRLGHDRQEFYTISLSLSLSLSLSNFTVYAKSVGVASSLQKFAL